MGDFISNYFAFYFLHLSMEQEQGNVNNLGKCLKIF